MSRLIAAGAAGPCISRPAYGPIRMSTRWASTSSSPTASASSGMRPVCVHVGAWHWHGAVPTQSMSHVTVQDPGLDLDVERRDYDEVYAADLGSA